MSETNRRVYIARRPEGMPVLEDFGIEDQAIDEVPEGMVLIKVDTISMDAFIRTTLDAPGLHETSPVGGTVTALGVGQVIASACDELAEGDWVTGPTLAQTHALMPGAMFQKIDVSQVPPSTYVGVLGMTTGLTAHVGMVTVGEVQEGDTVVVYTLVSVHNVDGDHICTLAQRKRTLPRSIHITLKFRNRI